MNLLYKIVKLNKIIYIFIKMMNYDYILLSLKTIIMGTIYTLCIHIILLRP